MNAPENKSCTHYLCGEFSTCQFPPPPGYIACFINPDEIELILTSLSAHEGESWYEWKDDSDPQTISDLLAAKLRLYYRYSKQP